MRFSTCYLFLSSTLIVAGVTWSCTEGDEDGDADNSGACTDGETKTADDGCNSCTCDNGEWSCTAMGCGSDPCVSDSECVTGGCSGEMCRHVEAEPLSSACVELPEYACYAAPYTSCGCNNGVCAWDRTPELISCLEAPSCPEGETQPAGDNCNTCTCTEGAWVCTQRACPSNCDDDTDCIETGCSGEVCASESISSTCEWREEYECYGAPNTSCGCQAGRCGWAQTTELTECLEGL